MGRIKALLPWYGVTLLEHQVRSLLGADVAEVVVVLGHQADEIASYVSGRSVRYVVNPDYKDGKTTSIKAGLEGIASDADAILLLAVDQPRTKDVISSVIEAHVENNPLSRRSISAPSANGDEDGVGRKLGRQHGRQGAELR